MKQDYHVIYSDRKTLSIIVERDRSILVRAPKSMSAGEVQQIVDEKKLWLYEKLRHTQKYPPEPVKKEFTTGETILYLGRNYHLELTNDNSEGIHFDSYFPFLVAKRNKLENCSANGILSVQGKN